MMTRWVETCSPLISCFLYFALECLTDTFYPIYFNTLICVLLVFKVQHFRRAYSDNNQLHLMFGRCTSSCIYIAYLSFQRPSLRMLPYRPQRTNLHCPNYRLSPLRHCQFSTDATSCGLQSISFALHCCTIILLWTLMWHANLSMESQDSVQSNLAERRSNKYNKGRRFLCTYRASCTIYYPEQQMNYIYIVYILYIYFISYVLLHALMCLIIPAYRKHQHRDYSYKTTHTVYKATKLTTSIYCNYNSWQLKAFIDCISSSTVTITWTF
jgi:hypothetical protein